MRKQTAIIFTLIACMSFLGCGAVATLFHGPQLEVPPVTYMVTFNANGASGTAPAALTVNDDTAISLPNAGGLFSTGNIFAGWNENANGSGIHYAAGASVIVTRDMVFYAQWLEHTIPQYTVTFDANGATEGIPPASQEVYSGISIAVPNQGTLVNDGKTFSGWNENADGSGTSYAAGVSVIVTRDMVLFAQWVDVIPQYSLTFNANGATGGILPAPQTVNSGISITIPSQGTLVNSGNLFIGWNENADGSGASYAAGASVTVTRDMVFYAQWELIPQYTVTFNSNGAAGTPPASQTVYSSVSITIPNQGTLVNSGYTFEGWNTQANADGTHYMTGASFQVIENVTLYAIWVEFIPFFTVAFDSNGGSEVASQIVDNGSTATRPSNPTRSRFNFNNWYNEPDLITVYNFSAPVTRNITLYARWTSIPMNFSYFPYILNGNTLIMNPQRMGDGTRVYTPDDPGCPRFLLEPGTAGTFPVGRWMADSNTPSSTTWLEFSAEGDYAYHYSYKFESSNPYTRTGNVSSGTIVHNGNTLPYVVNGNTLIFNPWGRGNGSRVFTPADPDCDKFDLVPTTAGTFPIGSWMIQSNYHYSDKNWRTSYVEFTADGNLVLVLSSLHERDGVFTLGTGEIGIHYW